MPQNKSIQANEQGRASNPMPTTRDIQVPVLPLLYNIEIITNGTNALIQWGEARDWQTTHAKMLRQAVRLSLIPKPGVQGLPVVTVELNEHQRWVLFSRVFGELEVGTEADEAPLAMRLYAIGWQTKVGRKNVKSLTWVYPNGLIENAAEPTFIPLFMQQLKEQQEATSGI